MNLYRAEWDFGKRFIVAHTYAEAVDLLGFEPDRMELLCGPNDLLVAETSDGKDET